jgi:anti-sigma B factor antagonist
MAILETSVVDLDDAKVLRVRGEVDLASSDSLMSAAVPLVKADLGTLRLDMTGVTFIDSSGIRSILLIDERCRESGVSFQVEPSEQVQRVMTLVGLSFDENAAAS